MNEVPSELNPCELQSLLYAWNYFIFTLFFLSAVKEAELLLCISRKLRKPQPGFVCWLNLQLSRTVSCIFVTTKPIPCPLAVEIFCFTNDLVIPCGRLTFFGLFCQFSSLHVCWAADCSFSVSRHSSNKSGSNWKPFCMCCTTFPEIIVLCNSIESVRWVAPFYTKNYTLDTCQNLLNSEALIKGKSWRYVLHIFLS